MKISIKYTGQVQTQEHHRGTVHLPSNAKVGFYYDQKRSVYVTEQTYGDRPLKAKFLRWLVMKILEAENIVVFERPEPRKEQ